MTIEITLLPTGSFHIVLILSFKTIYILPLFFTNFCSILCLFMSRVKNINHCVSRHQFIKDVSPLRPTVFLFAYFVYIGEVPIIY